MEGYFGAVEGIRMLPEQKEIKMIKVNRIWAVEINIGDNWFPIIESVSGIRGIRHTRAEAREAKRDMETARCYKTSVRYRIRKYEPVNKRRGLSLKGLVRYTQNLKNQRETN